MDLPAALHYSALLAKENFTSSPKPIMTNYMVNWRTGSGFLANYLLIRQFEKLFSNWVVKLSFLEYSKSFNSTFRLQKYVKLNQILSIFYLSVSSHQTFFYEFCWIIGLQKSELTKYNPWLIAAWVLHSDLAICPHYLQLKY